MKLIVLHRAVWIFILADAGIGLSTQILDAASFYASPSGSAAGAGTKTDPWDLQTALNKQGIITPGSMLYLIPGTEHYFGRFSSTLTGTPTSKIKVVALPGAVIDGFGGNALTSSIPAGAAFAPVSFTVSNPVLAQQYVGQYIKADIETFQVSQVAGNSVTATRGELLSCGISGTCPAHGIGASISMQTTTLTINGAYTQFLGLEVLYSGWLNRQSTFAGGLGPDEENFPGVTINGNDNEFSNGFIHDTGNGLVISTTAAAPVINFNRFQNNGWVDLNGTAYYGKELFSSQVNSTQQCVGNMFLPTYSGIAVELTSAYTEPVLPITTLAKNIVINGSLLLGGDGPVSDLSVTSNNIYNVANGQVIIGTQNLPITGNTGLSYTQNYVVSFLPTQVKYWTNATFRNNYFCNLNANQEFTFQEYLFEPSGLYSDYTYVKNTYCNNGIGSTALIFEIYNAQDPPTAMIYDFHQWQGFGYDTGGTALSGVQAKNFVTLIANAYNSESANLAVNNWSNGGNASVDLTSLNWPSNSSITLTSAENPAETPFTTTMMGQIITVPLAGWTMAIPIGATAPITASTYPNYGLWIVTRN